MSSWEKRKGRELQAKLDSLRGDLQQWRERSRSGQPLETHHSQVRRIGQDLAPVLDRLAADIAADDIATSWRTIERALLDLHRLWGYFRDKLVVRLVEDYARYLRAADDFAWACYLPAQRAAIEKAALPAEQVREPPLVCPSDVASPFSLARGSPYAAELGARGLTTAASRMAARRLPVPVVAVPWFQLNHLPDALILGHEVGHHVERDLGLGDEARAAVQAATRGAAGRAADAWPGWCTEAFCDVFGTLCGGTAFAMALADFLRVTGPPAADLDASYPPTEVRLGLCLAALEDGGCSRHAAALRDRWAREGLDLADGETAFAAAEVGRALAAASYTGLGDQALRDVVAFGPRREEVAAADAADLRAGRPARTRDIRVLMAAAGAAFAEEPHAYLTAGVAAAVLGRAQQIREPGVRWRGGTPPSDPDDAAQVGATLAGELYELLTATDPGLP